jgi:hypothetical protein
MKPDRRLLFFDLGLFYKPDNYENIWGNVCVALGGGEWSASRLGHFIRGERNAGPPLNRKLGGPQSRSGRYGQEK